MMGAKSDGGLPEVARCIPLLLASRRAPDAPGGLAGYERGLAAEFEKRTGAKPVLCALTGKSATSGTVLLDAMVREPRRIWMRLASRPLFHPLLEFSIRSAYRRAADRLLPRRPRTVHFIGTGWDFIGFALADFAKRNRARFTIWPAVHPGQWGDDRMDLRLYQMADTVFCQSRHEQDHLAALGLDRAKMPVCGLPPMCLPDGDGSRLRGRLGIGTRPAVLFLGLRSSGKGYPELLQAWRRVRAACPEAVLLVAGPDPWGKFPLPEEESIRDLGMPDEATKADVLAGCDVLALPSSHEAFGIVYVEAWSYGKPVLCGSAPASRELVCDGVTGLWVEQTPESIADGIIRLLRDRDLRHTLGEAGRRLQLERFTWDATLATHQMAWKGTGQ